MNNPALAATNLPNHDAPIGPAPRVAAPECESVESHGAMMAANLALSKALCVPEQFATAEPACSMLCYGAVLNTEKRQETLIDGMIMSIPACANEASTGRFVGGYTTSSGTVGRTYQYPDGREFSVPETRNQSTQR